MMVARTVLTSVMWYSASGMTLPSSLKMYTVNHHSSAAAEINEADRQAISTAGDTTKSEPIDLVYLWVNTSDPVWVEGKNDAIMRTMNESESISYARRFSPTVDHNELRLSLRSVAKYAPFVRNIYIVTNNQSIAWLEPDTQVRVVDADKLLREAGGVVPSYNTHALYLVLHRIPGLSATYLVADDDTLFLNPTSLETFVNGTKVVHYYEESQREEPGPYAIVAGRDLIGPGVLPHWEAHTFRPYRKTDLDELWEMLPAECKSTINDPLRGPKDLILPAVYPHFLMAKHPENIVYAPVGLNVSTIVLTCRISRDAFAAAVSRGVLTAALQDEACSDEEKRLFFQYIEQSYYPQLVSQERRPSLVQDTEHKEIDHGDRDHRMRVYGHRGIGAPRAGEVPIMENTISSFKVAAVAGVRHIELDVAITKDAVVIVHHGNMLYEGCKKGEHPVIIEATLAQLRAASSVEVNTLTEVLHAFHGKMGFQIELKQNTDYGLAGRCNDNPRLQECTDKATKFDALVRGVHDVLEITGFPASDLVISSFEGPRLQNFLSAGRSKEPYTMKLVDAGYSGTVDTLMNAAKWWLGPSPAVSVPLSWATAENVRALQSAGIRVEIGLPAYTSDCYAEKDAAEFRQLGEEVVRSVIALGADDVCGDYPRDLNDAMR